MIKLRPIIFTLGLVLSKLALFMWLPTLLALLTGSEGFVEFLKSVLITHGAALLCLHYGRKAVFHLGVREMFLLTTSVWVVACIFGALPFFFINHIDFTDAYFETMSGVTTTGSTVLSGLDGMAHSILLWRSILQWLGGVGFIVMAVAVLPYLNVGGMKLFQTESSDWSDKSAPRAKTVANNIVLVYLVLSMLCFLAYWVSGMTLFEAVNHSMTTLSTGGYSTSDQSMSHFSNSAHWIGTVFMFLGGLPFLLYVQSLSRRDNSLLKDAQVQGFFWLVVWVTVVVTFYLWLRDIYGFMDALRISCFNIVSVLTTTGFGLGDFGTWGPLTSIIFIILLALGACSGSTAGGPQDLPGAGGVRPVQEADAPADAPLRRLPAEVQRPPGQRRHHPLDDLLRAGLLRRHPADRRPARRHRAGSPDRHLGLHHRRGQRGSGHGADHRPQHQLRHPAGLGQVDPVVRHAAGTAPRS